MVTPSDRRVPLWEHEEEILTQRNAVTTRAVRCGGGTRCKRDSEGGGETWGERRWDDCHESVTSGGDTHPVYNTGDEKW